MRTITIRVFSAFAGFDTQYMALKRFEKKYNANKANGCKIKFKLVGWCEIDPYAIKSHNKLFPKVKKFAVYDRENKKMVGYHYSDITKIDWSLVPDFDIIIYSSCCQSITRAGAQKGMTEGSGTPSSLIWYIRDAIRIKKPKVCILENVAALLETKFAGQFEMWTDTVEELGYRNTWSTLCAANYGIPQNRNRVFLVSLREDLDKRVYFPTPIGCKVSAEQLLEDAVDDKYYFSQEETMKFLLDVNDKTPKTGILPSITGRGRLVKKFITPSCQDYALHICTTLVADKNYMKGNYKKMLSSTHYPRPGVLEVWKQSNNINMSYADVISSASNDEERKFKIMNASMRDIRKQIEDLEPNEYFRLRWMTPREWFRLMGVDENDIDTLCNSDIPVGQLYKQAGNAIVVDVLFHLFDSLFDDISKWWWTTNESDKHLDEK